MTALDPLPYVELETGIRWAFPIKTYPTVFSPRPEFWQEEKDY